jgi:hypothetical protein
MQSATAMKLHAKSRYPSMFYFVALTDRAPTIVLRRRGPPDALPNHRETCHKHTDADLRLSGNSICRHAYAKSLGLNNASGCQSGAGGAGSLERYPSLEQFLLKQAKMRHKPINGVPREVRKSIKRIHKGFLDECRKAGFRS